MGRLVEAETAGPNPCGGDSIVQGGTPKSVFLTSSHVMWMLLVQGTVFKNRCLSKTKQRKLSIYLFRFQGRRTVCILEGKKL